MKEINKKTLGRIGLMYGVIISLVNYMGYLLPATGKFSVERTEGFTSWLVFMDSHQLLITLLSIFSFAIPISFCILYITTCKPQNYKKRIINLPLVYSIIGASGWIITFLVELIFLFYVKFSFTVSIFPIVSTSFLNIIQEAIFIFILGYLILDTINRKLFLPKFFPEGNISRLDGILKPSVRFLFWIFYIAIGFFPVFFLTSTLFAIMRNNKISVSSDIFIVLAFIVVFGIVIVINFEHYFSSPLEKLIKGTENIKQGNYNEKVNIVSSDSFGLLADSFNEMTDSLKQKTQKILAIQDSVIKGMAVMVESRDNSTGGHINRTSDCVKVFVSELMKYPQYKDSISESFCKNVIKAAPMHDLGKIAVDDAILRKPGKFTDEEYEKMKMHSAEGARIVEHVLKEVDDEEFKQIAINVAHFHHEKWNGTGYPEKISGTTIPLEARIMALADVFDALVSKRCYKDKMSYDKAFQIIEESLGSHFDPNLGKIFIECRENLVSLYEKYE